MTYMPFYGPHKNIVELADKIIATKGNMDGEISDATNLYYSMKLISEIDRLYRCMLYYGGSSVIASEIKDHILKLQKALGILNEAKSVTEYFSDLSPNPDHPYVKLLMDCRDKGMPFDTAIDVVSSLVSIPEYQLKRFIEDEKIDYPVIDAALPDYTEGATDGVSSSDSEAVSRMLRSRGTLESDMNAKVAERVTDDPSKYFRTKSSSNYIMNTNFSNSYAEVENSTIGSYNYSGNDCHVNRNKNNIRLNSYIAGVLSSKNFSQDAKDLLRLNSKVVQFSRLLDGIFKDIEATTSVEKFISKVKSTEADKLADSLNNYVKKINVKEVLGDNL